MRRLAQGHHAIQLGGAGDRTSNLAVTSQPALPPAMQTLMSSNEPFEIVDVMRERGNFG